MTHDSLTAFFGWMTVLNFGLLTIAGLSLMAMRGWASDLHSRMFGLSPETVSAEYFRWLATYKVLVLVFCLTPWLALKIM